MSYNRPPNVVLAGRALKQTPAPTPTSPPGILPVTIDSDIATTTSLGVVRVGSGLSITPDGVLSANAESNCCYDCSSVVVYDNFIATKNNYYIGVQNENPITITLPTDYKGCGIVIKSEVEPPLGNRKITIKPGDSSKTIDGATSYTITIPYESVNLYCRDGNWFII